VTIPFHGLRWPLLALPGCGAKSPLYGSSRSWKLRGQASVPGLHTFRITQAGLQAFSRTLGLGRTSKEDTSTRRLSIGIPELDKMLGGGIPEGDSVLVAGARERESQSSWQPNSLLRAYVRGSRESWWSSKNGRKSMPSGQQFWSGF